MKKNYSQGLRRAQSEESKFWVRNGEMATDDSITCRRTHPLNAAFSSSSSHRFTDIEPHLSRSFLVSHSRVPLEPYPSPVSLPVSAWPVPYCMFQGLICFQKCRPCLDRIDQVVPEYIVVQLRLRVHSRVTRATSLIRFQMHSKKCLWNSRCRGNNKLVKLSRESFHSLIRPNLLVLSYLQACSL